MKTEPLNQITKEQQDHLINGGEMIYFVLKNIEDTELNQNSFPYYDNRKGRPLIKREVVKDYSPIQPNTKYYLQEEFTEYRGRIITVSEYNEHGLETLISTPVSLFNDASKMTEKEAKHFFEFDIEIKRIQEIVKDLDTLNKIKPITGLGGDTYENDFRIYHNRLHPIQPYESNPYIIIAKVKR